MKKTVSISIEAEVLALAREEAWRLKKSFSQFVEDGLNISVSVPGEQPLVGRGDELESEILAKGQAELLKKRIETKKGPVKANAAMDNFFNPVSKDRQLGKRKK